MVFTGREEKGLSINEEYSLFQFYSNTLFLFCTTLAMGLLVVIRTSCNTSVGF